MKNIQIPVLLFIIIACSCEQAKEVLTFSKWEIVEMEFEGPLLNEQASENPFTDYRLNVEFKHKDKTVTVPGYYAADGNAAETSADSGRIWRVKFVPDLEGDWSYKVSFRKGKDIAISDNQNAGKGINFDGHKNHFKVGPIASEHNPKGRLQYVGERYLKFQETGEYFLKIGPNSPENFLAYQDFDGTYPSDTTKNFIKAYKPHLQDWKTGDPTWQNGKGKGIIGAVNYIANQGMNTIYFLTMNIEGDGRDVWPYTAPNQLDRFDCSKLDQWNIVFDHMQERGIMLHFVTQETENELLLDHGDTNYFRKLYYRELVARFAHHQMITWNLGEENGPASFTPNGQNDRQRKDMATYLKQIDPYDNYLVVHTHSWISARDSIVDSLYNFPYIDGLSLQIDQRALVHTETIKYIDRSEQAGRIWVSSMDEIGKYWMGAMPDTDDPNHDTLRQEVLWGHLMAGGPGLEWYFGYKFPPADLDCEDWRSRDNLWKQSFAAHQFFTKELPFWEMKSHDELIDNKQAFCFANPGEIYAVYLKKRGNVNLRLENNGGYIIRWFDPKNGLEQLQTRGIAEDKKLELVWPFGFEEQDLLVLVQRD